MSTPAPGGMRSAGARFAIGAIGGLAPAALAVQLGMRLPLALPDRLLSATLLGCALYIPLLCWSLGALALMRFSAGALGSGVLLATAILLLPAS